MLVSVVFSFWNEEHVLQELISRVVKALETTGHRYELVFVNDDSTDSSLDILNSERSTNQNIRIINMSRRFGVSACVMAGLRFSRGAVVIYMDSDLQDPPELIPQMISLYENGAEVVNTVRTARRGESRTKMLVTRLAYRMINWISDIQLLENAGDFKLLGRRAVNEVIKLNEYQPYTRGLVPWVGFRQETLSYERDARFGGESKFSLLKSIGPFNEFIKGFTAFSEIPLYLALISGIIIALGAFCYLIFIIVHKSLGLTLPGWAAIMAVILFLGGITLITNGVIGIYVGRIFNNIKGRPAYIVDSTTGFEPDDETNSVNAHDNYHK